MCGVCVSLSENRWKRIVRVAASERYRKIKRDFAREMQQTNVACCRTQSTVSTYAARKFCLFCSCHNFLR